MFSKITNITGTYRNGAIISKYVWFKTKNDHNIEVYVVEKS